ncbi:MAG: hypothetical protein WD688_16405 [Candidatus Binatia bacterium]
MAKRTWKTEDYAGKSVRLTEERWRHILEHPEMARQKQKVRETLKKPDLVLTSHHDFSVGLYYRFYSRSPVGRKYLMVAVKILGDDAFIITAFFTDEVKGGTQIWPS